MQEIVLSVLSALGGGAIIIGGFAHWLGHLWAKRLIQGEKTKLDIEMESYKVKLKKSEFIFQKEFEAASELVECIQSILPEHYKPDMDWEDACVSIACNVEWIEVALKKYLGKHGAILTEIATKNIEMCIYLAGSTKHEITGPAIPASASKAGDEIYKKLKKAEKSLIEQVRGQSST